MVIVQEGSTNADKFFLCTTDNSGSIGSVNITFTVVVPSNVGDVTLNGVQTLTNKTLTSPVISPAELPTARIQFLELVPAMGVGQRPSGPGRGDGDRGATRRQLQLHRS